MNVEDQIYSLGLHKVRAVCPICGPGRKSKEPTMSLLNNHDGVVYNCWHCGQSGIVRHAHTKTSSFSFQSKPAYPTRQIHQSSNALMEQPKPLRLIYKDLTQAGIDYLQSRGISLATAQAYGLRSTTFHSKKLGGNVDAIAFPYGSGFKCRSIVGKDFNSDGPIQGCFAPLGKPENKGPVQPMVDSAVGSVGKDPIVFTEGEIDAMSCYEAGFHRSYSLPHGAVEAPTATDLKFKGVFDLLGDAGASVEVVLALDGDKPGIATRDELARRIGKDIVRSVVWPEGAKDANDIIIADGNASGLRAILESAQPYPVEGLYDVSHFVDQVKDLYIKGLGKGLSTGLRSLDDLYTITGGQLSVVTGSPSSGKSEFVDQVMVNLASEHHWKFAVASFENPPKLHIAKLISKREGKPFFTGPTKRIDENQLDRALKWVKDHFFFIHDDHGSTSDLDSILARLKTAVRRHGVKGCVIDPYNYITRSSDISETQWISDMLTKVCAFAKAFDVHVWFVAHPQKLQRGQDGKLPIPKGYDISGSAAWFAKADFGITVHRPAPDMDHITEVHVWKCRFSWMGKQGSARLEYKPASYSYAEVERPNQRYYVSQYGEIHDF